MRRKTDAEERFVRMFKSMSFDQLRGAHRLLFAGPVIDKRLWRNDARLLELCDDELYGRYRKAFGISKTTRSKP